MWRSSYEARTTHHCFPKDLNNEKKSHRMQLLYHATKLSFHSGGMNAPIYILSKSASCNLKKRLSTIKPEVLIKF